MQLPAHLTLSFFNEGLPAEISVSPEAIDRVARNRAFLEDLLKSGNTYYGINTGFGSLCNVRVAPDELSQLQENLVMSHACGMGAEVPQEIVRLMLLLKVHGLSQGYSGIRVELLQRLIDFYNLGITPVVFEQGSLGASGDLAPLAHLCLPILGKGLVWYQGEKMKAAQALAAAGLQPMPLSAKEGLALLNGTQFMTAYLTHSLLAARRLTQWADAIGALSADAFLAKDEPFRPAIHRLRPHAGQIDTAEKILQWLDGSELIRQPKEQVQDPYSFRCMPQVHGASKDALAAAEKALETEINSVTDNPIVLHDEGAIVSGGNFHGQTLAIHADLAAIALAELANISERRNYLLVSGQRGLKPFLAPEPGLNSGFMISQYAAAAIVSQNKQLCTPASVDSIVSSNGQEDHVSMGANAATKLLRVVHNVESVLGIELLTAAQALDMRRPAKSSPALENIVTRLRQRVPFMAADRVLHGDMTAATQLVTYEMP